MNAPKPGDVTLPLIVAYTKLAASHYNDIEKDLITLAVEETPISPSATAGSTTSTSWGSTAPI